MSDDNVQENPVPENKVAVARELREQVELRRGPADRTVIVFEYTYDTSPRPKRRQYYSFVAIWIAKTGRWYCSGRGAGSGVPREATHDDLMKLLGSENVRSANVATGLMPFKP